MREPDWQSGDVQLYCGDCLEILPMLEAGSVDAVVTDPPYSSGGMYRADRAASTDNKYQISHETSRTYAAFGGDNRDQRSFERWCAWWMSLALNTCHESSGFACFIDWRNIACVVDAMQVGGWVYRALTPWHKGTDLRPNKGWFRRNVEFIAWGTCGPILTGPRSDGGCFDGLFYHRVNDGKKQHQTGKPIALMVDVLNVRPEWRVILDPFMGSGTTGVACVKTGRKFIGIEKSPEYFAVAVKRIEAAQREAGLFAETASAEGVKHG